MALRNEWIVIRAEAGRWGTLARMQGIGSVVVDCRLGLLHFSLGARDEKYKKKYAFD